MVQKAAPPRRMVPGARRKCDESQGACQVMAGTPMAITGKGRFHASSAALLVQTEHGRSAVKN